MGIPVKPDYLGDGVYSRFDGFQIILTVDRHDNYESDIALEWQVFESLLRFAQRSFGVEITVKESTDV